MKGLFEPQVKMIEAIETGRYLITISSIHKIEGDKMTVVHNWIMCNFMLIDIVPTFTHLKNDYKAKDLQNIKPGEGSVFDVAHECQEHKDKDDVFKSIRKAQIAGNILLTISCQKKYRPADRDDLQHFWFRSSGFIKNVVIEGLEYIEKSYKSIYEKGSEIEDFNWY
jgi:hypothetical protein